MYTSSEITRIKTLIQNLISENHIQIAEMDAFANAQPYYLPKAELDIVAALTKCSGFDSNSLWQYAMASAASVQLEEIQGVYAGTFAEQDMLYDFWREAMKAFRILAS